MPTIHTEITIQAPKEKIWKILTDFASYPEWNPFIIQVTGSPSPGSMVFFIAKIDKLTIPIVANIQEFEMEKKFSWGGPPIRLLRNFFSAEHFFIIEELEKDKCRFINTEKMEGLIPDALRPFIENGKPAYEAMNEALKKRSEM